MFEWYKNDAKYILLNIIQYWKAIFKWWKMAQFSTQFQCIFWFGAIFFKSIDIFIWDFKLSWDWKEEYIFILHMLGWKLDASLAKKKWATLPNCNAACAFTAQISLPVNQWSQRRQRIWKYIANYIEDYTTFAASDWCVHVSYVKSINCISRWHLNDNKQLNGAEMDDSLKTISEMVCEMTVRLVESITGLHILYGKTTCSNLFGGGDKFEKDENHQINFSWVSPFFWLFGCTKQMEDFEHVCIRDDSIFPENSSFGQFLVDSNKIILAFKWNTTAFHRW